MNYKDIAESLLELLIGELEEEFDMLYELGEITDSDLHGLNYEDARDMLIDRHIVDNTIISYEQLDKLMHGEE